MAKGSLTVVGTGIQLCNQTTPEAMRCLKAAEKLFYLSGEPATGLWLSYVNPSAESLHRFYQSGKDRSRTYEEMVEHILEPVRGSKRVCVASYGHPGVFGYPLHQSLKRAGMEGFTTRMLPGISAEDCLFADIGVDPGNSGCQSFEATDFLIRERRFDTRSVLILWQIGLVGVSDYRNSTEVWSERGLIILAEYLALYYPSCHEVIVYEASIYPISSPTIQRTSLSNLVQLRVTPLSTLYIPPIEDHQLNREMANRLGIDPDMIKRC
jgi:uncharacterized protein YabN with tetrapyrrole methylase and pyrophosphatase domain